jgi:LAO/AO transport system kinase
VSLVDDGIVGRALAGDFRAVARLITLVENERPEAVPYMRELFRHTGRCLSIGITGAPGAGKSTLVDKLAAHYRQIGHKVGIIAVDPTSPFTGGAILGDRIRMQARALDTGTFIRSMATRGNLGGLSRSTADVLLILDAAGFDVVLIETVGVGQDEIDVARTAQLTLVLLVPGMGDDIQAMKAGIMEIADVFVINKADHAGVERMEAELNALRSLSSRADGWKPPIVKTVAPEGRGVSECVHAIESWLTSQKGSHFQRDRSIQMHRARLLDLVRSEFQRRLLREDGVAGRLDELAVQISERKIDPFSAAEELLRLWGSSAG